MNMGKFHIIKKASGTMVLICMVLMFVPLSSYAARVSEETELVLHYEGEKNTFHFYKVAALSLPDQYTVESKFKIYEGKVTGLDRLGKLTTEETKMLASTLRSLTFTDNIEPDQSLVTDEEGIVSWENIPNGFYLIVGEKTFDEEYVYTPLPLLLSVPYQEGTGEWEEEVEILHNKTEKRSLKEKVDIPVLMIWEDGDNPEERPETTSVMMFRGPNVYEEEPFSEENGWSYTWEDLPPEEEWNVEESELPPGYTYSFVPKEDGIMIINSYPYEISPPLDEKLPQTGQIWWPVPVLLVWGCSFYFMGWMLEKNKIV